MARSPAWELCSWKSPAARDIKLSIIHGLRAATLQLLEPLTCLRAGILRDGIPPLQHSCEMPSAARLLYRLPLPCWRDIRSICAG